MTLYTMEILEILSRESENTQHVYVYEENGRWYAYERSFLGGPLHFLSELRKAFIRTLNLDDEHIIAPNHSHLFAAIGSALNSKKDLDVPIQEMQKRLEGKIKMEFEVDRMEPLLKCHLNHPGIIRNILYPVCFISLDIIRL